MIERNRKVFEISGIFKFWDKGYNGKGIKIAELEGFRKDSYYMKDKIKNPFNSGNSTHGTQVMDVMNQVAPDAIIYSLPQNLWLSSNDAGGQFFDIILPYILTEKIHIIGASLGGENHPILNAAIENLKNTGVTFVTSAGNDDNKGLSGYAKSNIWIAVGAVGYNYSLNKIILKNYSSIGKELDIVSFSGIYVHPISEDGGSVLKEGTSFSSPMVVGMLALVQQFFMEKIGRILYQDEIEKFILDHIIDLGDAGFDEMFGHGLFALPDPSEINVKKYLLRGDKDMEIKMQIGNSKYYVDGVEKYMDTIPILDENNRTLVPIRFIAEAMNYEVEWIQETEEIIIRK